MQNSLGSIPFWLSSLFKISDLWTLSIVMLVLTINKTLKWLSSLPMLKQESF